MRAIGLVVVLLAAACCAPPKPPPAPPAPPAVDLAPPAVDLAPPAIASCELTPNLRPEHVCPNQFTDEGLACVNCGAAQGCYEGRDQVYCVRGGCALDPRCRLRRDLSPFRAPGRR